MSEMRCLEVIRDREPERWISDIRRSCTCCLFPRWTKDDGVHELFYGAEETFVPLASAEKNTMPLRA